MIQTMPQPKQPNEFFPVSMDFSKSMLNGEAIIPANSQILVYELTSNEDVSTTFLKDSLIVVDSTKLQVTVNNGESGKAYKVTFIAYISETKQLEEDLIIKVKE